MCEYHVFGTIEVKSRWPKGECIRKVLICKNCGLNLHQCDGCKFCKGE